MSKEFKLDRRIATGSRVSGLDFKVRLYKIVKRDALWMPYLYHNGVSFSFDDSDHIHIIDSFQKFVKRHTSNHLYLFDIDDSLSQYSGMDSKFFTYYSSKDTSLKSVIKEASDAGKSMAQECLKNGLLEAPSRPYDVLFLRVNSDDLKELSENKEYTKRLLFLIKQGSNFRLPVFFLSDTPARVWNQFLENINWAAYMGEENEEKARKIYPDLNEGSFIVTREVCGLLASFDKRHFEVLQNTWNEPSEYKKLLDAKHKADEKIYEDFLEEVRQNNER